ncbi:LLM class flavin-dependent oxidoreductase [Jiangella rhizosphaerae]|uniref:LLM class flavin-dependent oxidoreductase n=1 Tax=Jiangella rhizosphaerae TaxID=2293569 RepID=A0A418KLT1_9ACTN|nr:LLM class flavin-dependent oxidoreductase [Jiangella rhizosphaerae]RIQ18890.1 LLM class flavin-dependent oxidoreductase [Jiangella rhizosphaerae]
MRLAFSVSGHRPSRSAVAAAVAAEQAGFDEVWVTEDYVERGAFALAGAIAQATSSVRVGIGVVNPWTRHPVVLAMEFATLDELSGGRALAGLGASNERWMTGQLGIPFERPLSRLAETVDVVRRLLAGEHVRHSGEAYTVDTALSFQPVRPDLPIVLGVKGPRALELAARAADGVLLSFLAGPEYIRLVRSRVGPSVELAGYVGLSVADSGAEARDRIRPLVARFLGIHGDHLITRSAGLSPSLCAQFRAGLVAGAPRVDLVTDDLLDRLVAAGTPGEVAAAFARFAAAGLDVAVVRDDPAVEPEETLRQAADAMAGGSTGS